MTQSKPAKAQDRMHCPNAGCDRVFSEGEDLRHHMAECTAEGNGEPAPPPELPPFPSIPFSPTDQNDLSCHVHNAVLALDDIRWAKLRLQGSEHKDSGWYRKMKLLPDIIGFLDQIGCILAQYGIKGFRFKEGSTDVDVYEVNASQPRLSKTKLMELGVDAAIIAQATTRVPYTAIIVKTHTERSVPK